MHSLCTVPLCLLPTCRLCLTCTADELLLWSHVLVHVETILCGLHHLQLVSFNHWLNLAEIGIRQKQAILDTCSQQAILLEAMSLTIHKT